MRHHLHYRRSSNAHITTITVACAHRKPTLWLIAVTAPASSPARRRNVITNKALARRRSKGVGKQWHLNTRCSRFHRALSASATVHHVSKLSNHTGMAFLNTISNNSNVAVMASLALAWHQRAWHIAPSNISMRALSSSAASINAQTALAGAQQQRSQRHQRSWRAAPHRAIFQHGVAPSSRVNNINNRKQYRRKQW